MNTMIPRAWFSDFEPFFAGNHQRQDAYWPLVESYVKDGQLQVRVDVPGVDPKDVEVSLHGRTLFIRGERKDEREEKSGYRETRYGRFERSFVVPNGIDADKVTAKVVNGVLEVNAPLPAAATARKIPVGIAHETEIKAVHETETKKAA